MCGAEPVSCPDFPLSTVMFRDIRRDWTGRLPETPGALLRDSSALVARDAGHSTKRLDQDDMSERKNPHTCHFTFK